MMDHLVTAKIIWEKPEIILKKYRLGKEKYMTNIRFESFPGLWSAVIILDPSLTNETPINQPQNYKIGFLFPENIIGLLKIDLEFVLVEGTTSVIGTGIINRIMDN